MLIPNSNAMPGLSRLLNEREMTAYRLAKSLQWKPDTIYRYLRGERSPSIRRLQTISNHLNCEVKDLFDGVQK